jgi:catechol 2,3-dioxygenase-like lactoylglutathione lyase family enzyme
MKRTWPIIGVADVAASNAWWQTLLGQTPQAPHHDDFAMITDTDETVLVCLHQWGSHDEGPPLKEPGIDEPGNGCLLFIRVDDFDAALERAKRLVDRFETDPDVFVSGPDTRSFTVRDPDGYYVTINEIV